MQSRPPGQAPKTPRWASATLTSAPSRSRGSTPAVLATAQSEPSWSWARSSTRPRWRAAHAATRPSSAGAASGHTPRSSRKKTIAHDRNLARNLGAAAHLVHGSSEGRFRIVYCTDPTSGGLSRKEVEGVGYEWRPLGTELEQLGVDGSGSTGPRTDRGGRPFHHIAQPGLGLWTSRPIEG